jgi:CheY-like chemotaxis protein
MSRILLVHWNDDEAHQKARVLKGLKHCVEILSDSEKPGLSRVRESPPDLLLIDLDRLPSHGREIAGYFRRQKSTRQVPILFVSDDAGRLAGARKLIPDAEFAKWADIENAITKAIKNAPVSPAVPGTMAGYSGTPLPKKLGIREGHSVALINAPDTFERKLTPLPADAQISDEANRASVAVLFVKSEAELVRDFRPLAKTLPEKTALWIAWPKKASGVMSDLSENIVREFGLGGGWVDYKVCAIDETWSGLCFARKKV